jgi:hypothetical protein
VTRQKLNTSGLETLPGEYRLLVGIVRQAQRDLCARSPKVREDAWRFLESFSPTLAEKLRQKGRGERHE